MESGIFIGIGVIVIIAVVLFGGTAIITTFTEDVGEKFSDTLVKTNERCDLCLKQFAPDVYCTHESTSKPCVELMKYSCITNCTVELK